MEKKKLAAFFFLKNSEAVRGGGQPSDCSPRQREQRTSRSGGGHVAHGGVPHLKPDRRRRPAEQSHISTQKVPQAPKNAVAAPVEYDENDGAVRPDEGGVAQVCFLIGGHAHSLGPLPQELAADGRDGSECVADRLKPARLRTNAT